MQYRRLFSFILASSVLVAFGARASAEDKSADEGNVIHYTVNPGDTLGSIALEHGVDFDDVRQWNELQGLEVTPGDEIVVKSDKKTKKKRSKPLPVVHVVRRGDTFEGIANKYGVSISKVKQWNRRLNPRRLQLGQRVRLYIPGRDGKSVSWGSASGGRLYNGIALEDSPGLKVRSVSRAYGTKRTLQFLRAAAADVQARWPDAPRLVVGDLSYKSGGRIRGHSSHQSGRDADVSYYYRGNVQLPNLYQMTYEMFDAVKNWHLFKTLIDTGEVEYIFVEHGLQRALYEYARSIGYTKEELEPILQYPRPTHERVGIIRHSPGHDTHFHIRFTCGPQDRNCN